MTFKKNYFESNKKYFSEQEIRFDKYCIFFPSSLCKSKEVGFKIKNLKRLYLAIDIQNF